MKAFIYSILLTLLFGKATSQVNEWELKLRLPIQYEMQKAEVPYSWGNEILKGKVLNFGGDILIVRQIAKASLQTGVGLFRNRFNIKRPYDHQLLNNSIDSLPIGTFTESYSYSLLRFPIAAYFDVITVKQGFALGVGAEYVFNFSFHRKYNGRLPFNGARTSFREFSFFGNAINVLFILKKGKLEAEPYMRLYQRFKKDRFLRENENDFHSSKTDAFGIAVKYQFHL